MTRHKVKRNEFRLEDGSAVSIEYWTGLNTVHVAAFDTDKHRISQAEYQATVDTSDELTPERQMRSNTRWFGIRIFMSGIGKKNRKPTGGIAT